MPRRTAGQALAFRLIGAGWFRSAFVGIFEALFGLEMHGTDLVPRDRAVIFVGNHGSHYDGLFSLVIAFKLRGTIPVMVAWSGIRKIPYLAQVFDSGALPTVFADDPGRDTTGDRAGALDQMVSYLQSGKNVVVHAEGRRYDELATFQEGAAFAAIESGAPVVPFTLRGVQGLWKALPRPDRWHGKVSVHFHAPVDPADYADLPRRKAIEAITAEVRRRVASALDYPDGRAA